MGSSCSKKKKDKEFKKEKKVNRIDDQREQAL